jgi:hypothetical protein
MGVSRAVDSPVATAVHAAQTSAHRLEPAQWVTFPARHCRAPLRACVRTACELTNSAALLAHLLVRRQEKSTRYSLGQPMDEHVLHVNGALRE